MTHSASISRLWFTHCSYIYGPSFTLNGVAKIKN